MRNFIQDNLATCKPNELKNNILSLPYDKKFLDYYIQNFIIRGNLHKIIKSRIFNQVEIAILEKSIITNDDYLNIFEQYKDNNKAFLFLDPPYIFSENKAYNLIDDDVTSIMVKIYEYFLICKCKCMLIINDLYILRYIFKNFIKGSYIKIYMIGKKKMSSFNYYKLLIKLSVIYRLSNKCNKYVLSFDTLHILHIPTVFKRVCGNSLSTLSNVILVSSSNT